MPTLPAALGRTIWGLGDQAVSSLTNFAVGIVVARALGPEGFGAFSLVFATYLITISVARALASEPLIVRYSAASSQAWRGAAGRATGTSAAIGAVAGIACLAIGLLWSGPVGAGLLGLGVCLPGLLVQDCWRFAFMARATPRSALMNDSVWAIVLALLLGAVLATDATSVLWAVLAWGGGATAAAAVGVLQASVLPRPTATHRWWVEHRDVAPQFAGESVALAAATQLSLFGIGAVAGISAVGAFRGGLLLFAPMQLLLLAAPLVAVPEAARALRAGASHLRIAALVGVALSALALTLAVFLLLLPDEIGRWILGDTWDAARPLLGPLTLAVLATAVLTGPFVSLRALAASRHSLRARSVNSVAALVAEVAGAAAAGAIGAAWGSAAGMWIGAAVWWRELRDATASDRYARRIREGANRDPTAC